MGVKLEATELQDSPGSQRRLQDNQTTWYEIVYEVAVPSHMDAAMLAERLNLIAVAQESHLVPEGVTLQISENADDACEMATVRLVTPSSVRDRKQYRI